jgi:hypothetical protein
VSGADADDNDDDDVGDESVDHARSELDEFLSTLKADFVARVTSRAPSPTPAPTTETTTTTTRTTVTAAIAPATPASSVIDVTDELVSDDADVATTPGTVEIIEGADRVVDTLSMHFEARRGDDADART